MAKARTVPDFAESRSFREAAARTMQVRAQEVFDHREGVLDTADIERVHDMRVATRRLRAVMEIFAPCFPKRPHGVLLKEVKALADSLGERRDADVAIKSFEAARTAMPIADRPGIDHMLAELRAEQERANGQLAEMLNQIDGDGLHERLLALAAETAPAHTPAAAEPTVAS